MNFGTNVDNIENYLHQIILKYIKNLKNETIIEFGYNTGLIASLLSKYCKKWLSYERSRVFLKNSISFNNVEIYNGWLDDSNFSRTHKVIICNNIIKYSENISKYFFILSGLLDNEGYIFIIEHYNNSTLDKLNKISKFMKDQLILNLIHLEECPYSQTFIYILRN